MLVVAVLLVAPFLVDASPAADPPTIVIDDVTQLEGTGGVGQMAFTVRLTAPSSQQTVVNFATGDDPTGLHPATGGGSCDPGVDYLSLQGAVTIPANPNSPPSTQIFITTCGDSLNEFDETFVVNIFNPSPPLQIERGQARGTLINDDPLPSLSLTPSTLSLFEGNAGTANAALTVRLSSPSGKTVTVQPTVSNGTATGGAACGGPQQVDFINTPPALVTFAPLQTTATVNVPVCGDLTPEPNETFFVDLTNATNGTIGSGHATVTIKDDDTPPNISIGDASTVEGNICCGLHPQFSHGLPFTVSLNRAFGQDVTVQYTTANGTAASGASCVTGIFRPDYERVGTPRTLTIPAYTTSAKLSIGVCHDALFEPNKTFFVDLANASAGTIIKARGIGTIINDDPTPGTFELTPPEVTARVGDHVTYTLKWTVPEPRVWRDLSTIDLRLSDDRATAIWVRWEEATNSFRLVNPSGSAHGPRGRPGDSGQLVGAMATLNLESSSVVGSGPTGRSVTLTLDLVLKQGAGGHTFKVEVAGADDLGDQAALAQAGTLVVE
jgi:hypothetical protein